MTGDCSINLDMNMMKLNFVRLKMPKMNKSTLRLKGEKIHTHTKKRRRKCLFFRRFQMNVAIYMYIISSWFFMKECHDVSKRIQVFVIVRNTTSTKINLQTILKVSWLYSNSRRIFIVCSLLLFQLFMVMDFFFFSSCFTVLPCLSALVVSYFKRINTVNGIDVKNFHKH